MESIHLKDEFIKLGQALKLAGLVGSGVDAKFVIQDGLVKVNGEVETQRGKKLYPGDTVSYDGKTFKGEIDFVAIKDGKKCFIQVAYLLASEETIQREFGAYSKITDASPKYVMSLDKLDMSHDGIVHMNIIDFLLRKKDLMLT